jgi:multiple sugar transport system substrate-binding protein
MTMMFKRPLLRAVLAGAALTASLAATLATGLAQAQTKELVVASFPSFDEAVKAAIPLYKKVAPNVTIKLVSLSYADHHNAMVTALSTGAGLPDVAGIEVGYLGRLIESGGLEDLSKPPYNALAYRSKIVPFTFAQASRRDGALSAMPADLGPGSLFYRQDLLAKAGVTEAQLTQSWESFIEAGKTLKAKTGVLLVPNATTLSDVFIRTNLAPGEGLFFDKNDKALIATPRFEKAFALAKAVRAAGLDGKFAPFTTEWSEGFKRGTFATEMSGAWLATHLSKYIAPETKGLWRAAPLPAGAFASWGGSFYGIPKKLSDDRKKMAWDFIVFMATNKEMQLAAFKQLDAYPALIEAASDPFVDEPIEFLGGQKARQIWRTAAARIPAIEVNKLDSIATEIVAAELDKVLVENKDIKAALADAQRQVERRVRR